MAIWTLDPWFIHEQSRQFDLDHLESLAPRLTDETRAAILEIKHAWHGHPDYSSYAIYTAVLDHGVRTPSCLVAQAHIREPLHGLVRALIRL